VNAGLAEVNVGLAVEKTNKESHLSNMKIIKIKLEELKLIMKDKPVYMAFFLISQIIGWFLSWIGFRLWYLRVQKYQDIILVEEVRSYRSRDNPETK
jgi:hypothetical protein